MYTSFTIENFRLFDHLTVAPLARVNLIAGENNAGKTALLEALWLHSRPDPRAAGRLANWRGVPLTESEVLFADLFRGYQTDLPIKIEAKGDIAGRLIGERSERRSAAEIEPAHTILKIYQSGDAFDDSVVFEYSNILNGDVFTSRAWLNEDPDEEGFVARPYLQVSGEQAGTYYGPCIFANVSRRPTLRELAVKFGRVEISGHLTQVQKVLQLVEPRLQRLTAVPMARGSVLIYGDIGVGRLVPVSVMGDGLQRLLNVTLSFIDASHGLIFIDEIENGLHHSVLPGVWTAINQLSQKFNVQVFATTHSYECIQAANNSFTEMESDELYLHRLYRQGDRVKTITYNKEALCANIEYLWELR